MPGRRRRTLSSVSPGRQSSRSVSSRAPITSASPASQSNARLPNRRRASPYLPNLLLIGAQWSGRPIFHLHPIDSRNELINLIRVLLKSRNIVVTDQEHLEAEGTAGLVDDLDQPWDQIGAEPAVLFIKNEKAAVDGRIKGRKGEHSQPDRQDVDDGATLPFHDVFGLAVALDVEAHRRP